MIELQGSYCACENADCSDEMVGEVWFGTQINALTSCLPSRKTLNEYIKDNLQLLGPHEKNELQFIFKVCARDHASCLQIYPYEHQASALRHNVPNLRTITSDKRNGSMVIALRDSVTLLAGFRPAGEIQQIFMAYPELLPLMHFSNIDFEEVSYSPKEFTKRALARIFNAILTCSSSLLNEIMRKIGGKLEAETPIKLVTVMRRMFIQSAYDARMYLIPLFLNCVTLQEWEAFEIPPNVPHIFVSGHYVEVSISNNVLRAVKSKKPDELALFMKANTYLMRPVELLRPSRKCNGIDTFSSALFPEFAVECIVNECPFIKLSAASILIVFEGQFYLETENHPKMLIHDHKPYFLPVTLKWISISRDEHSTKFVALRVFTPL